MKLIYYIEHEPNGRIVGGGTAYVRSSEDIPRAHKGATLVEVDHQESAESHYWENGRYVEKPERPSKDHYFDYTTKTWAPNPENAWLRVRSERDRKLSSSDWMVTKAIETGSPMPEGWATYRQALRDVTLQDDPFVVVWPAEPA